jgi:hypothetical protein
MPATTQALVIAILILSPGYIFTQVARRSIAYIEESTDGRFFLTLITMGTVIHAIMFHWSVRIYRFYQSDTLVRHDWEFFFWGFTTIFFLPLSLGALVGWLSTVKIIDRLLDRFGFGYVDRTPSAWDYAIKGQYGRYVRVYLKDGKGVIAGVYSVRSLGSTNPRRPDLYLEEQWLLDEDGNFDQPLPDSSGVWIAHDTIGHVEFLEGEDEPYEQGEAAAEGDEDAEEGNPGEAGSLDRQGLSVEQSRSDDRGQGRSAIDTGQAIPPTSDPTGE